MTCIVKSAIIEDQVVDCWRDLPKSKHSEFDQYKERKHVVMIWTIAVALVVRAPDQISEGCKFKNQDVSISLCAVAVECPYACLSQTNVAV